MENYNRFKKLRLVQAFTSYFLQKFSIRGSLSNHPDVAVLCDERFFPDVFNVVKCMNDICPDLNNGRVSKYQFSFFQKVITKETLIISG